MFPLCMGFGPQLPSARRSPATLVAWTDTIMKTHSLNRREFLTATTLSTVVLATEASLLCAAEPAPTQKRPIGIGFLGAVHSHAADKLTVVRASNDYNLIGVCEQDPAVQRDLERRGIKLLSETALLQIAEVVAVESAVRDHARHARLALEAEKHVQVEKPPAVTLEELQALVSLARQKKLLLQVGYMWRHNPGFAAIFEAVRQGWLGEVFLVRGTINNSLAPERRPQWAEFKGGSMFELGSHLIDATVRLLGKPRSVTPFLRRDGVDKDALKDNNVAVLEFAHAVAVIMNSALQKASLPQRSFEVLGSKGTAILRPIEPPALQVDLVEAAGPYHKGVQTVNLPGYKRYEADFAELAAAVRGERKLNVTLDEEVAVQETLLKASGML
jgi:predicted dehydrogenase